MHHRLHDTESDHEHHRIEGVDPLSAEVFRAFKSQMVLNRRLMTKMFTVETMHPAQAMCLRALSREDGISQTDLADALHVSRPTVTTMLQKMEAAGVIERRDDEHDARLTRIYMTEAGRAMSERFHALFADSISASVGQMPEDDRRELVRLLDDLNEHVRRAIEAFDETDTKGKGETTR
ncbi:MAG: hypothetical protein CVT66_01050 [Actinobacteria bacterium HGW-Actinobacteria-6]|jgi:DNA-binding MarR family transcriptional regulator|nr:MAG: hypothetical protein CVT66_01050 [Actinobacteria bacterium HGW-Actinobacteria-6]